MKRFNKSGRYLIMVLSVVVLNSCVDVHDTFKSKMLVSGKGEKIYINTLNWGVTDDYQYTVVTKNSTLLKDRKDTISGIKGLDPFIYKFSGDTLTIFFQKENRVAVKEEFKTIQLNYIPLDNKDYIKLLSDTRVIKNGCDLVSE
ncbi:hypothetical protein GN157_12480 [Flavobacterium rakeshii]|uniref:Uncharacterized protein n=1 Tax=Flavobacterium rakeshii TaxID=1038845 RepID=A0A6N8HFM4_9FLAO|nr:hypothetical protein [Flavobacterium rakeshii]MUV04527.1 hypothetical protein [Flavobacterium rakeshii]